MKKLISLIITTFIFTLTSNVFADNSNIDFSNQKYYIYSKSISLENRDFLLNQESCLSVAKYTSDVETKKEFLLNKIIFLNLFGDNATKIIEEDKQATNIIQQNSFIRNNLSFKYYKIISGKDLTKKDDSFLYQDYITWLNKFYGDNLSIEGNIYKALIGKKLTLEMYIENLFKENNFSKDNSLENLQQVCVSLDYENKTIFEKTKIYILTFLNKYQLITSICFGIILILIGYCLIKNKKKKIKKINFFKIISAEKK